MKRKIKEGRRIEKLVEGNVNFAINSHLSNAGKSGEPQPRPISDFSKVVLIILLPKGRL